MLAVHNRIITDKSGPALVYATLNTHNTDTITDDQITLRFSENISDLSGNVHQYFNVNNGGSLGTNSPLSTGISAQDNTLIATLGDTASSMTINTSTIALESSNVIFDLTSPANGNIGTTPVTITDGTAPLLLSGTTIDADGDGYIDGYDLVFNENIDDSSFDINDISIAGASNLIFSTLIGNDDHLARILFDDGILDSGQTPNITANAGYVSDASVNSNQSLAVVVGEVPQIDGAKPVIWTRSTITDDGDYDGYTDTLSIQFSEDVVYQTSTGQAVTWDYDDWNMIDSINGFDYTTVIGMESLSGTQATITFTDTV
ncbi:MAG: hypothetical protein U9Q15_04975 [Patescibacteria group bacterium]|nr:hypothetical protein [Patescibacteria group bacterium]